ncbi:exportin 1 [Tieghemostelium lacteum]|uniref:Exportin-1 n=1 Tax=Tieghemostelium lacteum TaxID=361077 RepID=A0A151ZEN7_TIELA|nr:exportin 1 [Tieghemostelium lacteum]|eukprot:KYQ92422.1 exportin 1 [Tieghemostelium lacteum]
MALTILKKFQDHADAWTKVDQILEFAQNKDTKFFALVILESLIKYRWKSLPREQCEGIKTYIVSLIIKLSSDPNLFAREKMLINKLNIIFVQILKQEWPNYWGSFIPEIVSSSKTNETLCENNMNILKILSEEIFDFSEEQMTQAKIQNLKTNFEKEFSLINELCQYILEKATKASLVKATLITLQKFLNWIPLHYIFATPMGSQNAEPSALLNLLLFKYLPEPHFRTETLKCLIEIGSLTLTSTHDNAFIIIINQVMTQMKQIKPDPTKIPEQYEDGDPNEQNFIHALTLFLTGFFRAHIKTMENPQNVPFLKLGHEILVSISSVDDIEIFKICLEYWNFLSSTLYADINTYTTLLNSPPRVQLYKTILVKVRVVLIDKMAKPEEVIVVQDENGNAVRELTKDTDSLTLYESMRETLIFLTNLDAENTQQIMLDKLNSLIAYKEWSCAKLNTLCWAIGSISGAQSKEQEKRFLVTVIKELLELCQIKRGKDNKAIIASDIMYIVGQYPRFLKDHWKFLKTVVNKLFEFMHESHPGVQDMACDTFLKISKQCKRKFVIQQLDESQPFINELLINLLVIVQDLEAPQIQTFYEAVGYMIGAVPDHATRDKLVGALMEQPNQQWFFIMSQASASVENLFIIDSIRSLVNILKINHRVAMALGNAYLSQMTKIYLDLLNVYRTYSDYISKKPEIYRHTIGQAMRTVKKETLKLLETFVDKTEDKGSIYANFTPHLLNAILGDYQTNIPEVRDPEVLSLLTVLITSLKTHIYPDVTKILEAVFECTLGMITKNFEDYPYHRINFFNLIRAINTNAFQVFHNLQPAQFKLLIDCIIWAFKHTERNISETGLHILKEMIENVSKDINVANQFFPTYYVSLLNDVLFILTDSLHKSGFLLQCEILKTLFQIVENGICTVPLFDLSQNPGINTNSEYVKTVTGRYLESFPNLTKPQILSIVNRFFERIHGNPDDFKNTVRDFLIQLKEFQGSDNVELYQQERELEKQENFRKAQTIPGLVKQDYNVDMGDN